MKEELSFHRKHYSNSIKRILPHVATASNPESPSKASTIPVQPIKNPRNKRMKTREEKGSYEKMVD
jgi:hypothetical protein